MTTPLQIPATGLPTVAESPQASAPDIVWRDPSRASTANQPYPNIRNRSCVTLSMSWYIKLNLELMFMVMRNSSRIVKSCGTHVPLRGSSAISAGSTVASLRPSMLSFDPFGSYQVSDLTTYAMDDQRWTLQRKKIGLKRGTRVANQRKVRNLKTRDINLSYILSNFSRMECLRYVQSDKYEDKEVCYCGLTRNAHIPLTQLLKPTPKTNLLSPAAGLPSFKAVIEDTENDLNNSVMTSSLLSMLPFGGLSKPSFLKKSNALAPLNVSPLRTPPPPVLEEDQQSLQDLDAMEGGIPSGRPSLENLLNSNMINPRRSERRGRTQRYPSPANTSSRLNRPPTPPRIPPPDSTWTPKSHFRNFTTNAFGKIEFVKETSGSNKPAKYVRLAIDTNMESVLTLLSDYWRLLEPHRPQLVISVTGGAKNFKLDGKKKDIFSTGLIKVLENVQMRNA
ncbi:Transient receptor putative cation channel subfamily M member 2 [Halocaridina rubra]|uniref:Transient receptor putative cation channel subfamily M member 2 n=1 Tax=Halocaridina rubra TaxID=373956 RepID=A0AAN8X536_HALRR